MKARDQTPHETHKAHAPLLAIHTRAKPRNYLWTLICPYVSACSISLVSFYPLFCTIQFNDYLAFDSSSHLFGCLKSQNLKNFYSTNFNVDLNGVVSFSKPLNDIYSLMENRLAYPFSFQTLLIPTSHVSINTQIGSTQTFSYLLVFHQIFVILSWV